MDIIPVIDLLDGHVVHAMRGQRSNYLPIQSQLCGGSQPLDIIRALLDLHPFRQLYIADLNAIQKKGSHTNLIYEIKTLYPHLDIWLDIGLSKLSELKQWQDGGIHPVLGSENVPDIAGYREMKKGSMNETILSLDFHPEGFHGPAELLEKACEWPEKIILMTLAQVGSMQGPNLEKLKAFINLGKARHTPPCIYAAGGIRNMEDIGALQRIGVAGALVASALHRGEITGAQLAALAA